jgi:phosphoribosyl-ATP pyrophosphohydrolase
MSTDVLSRLAETIHQRWSADSEKSYTKQMLDAGPARCARKFGEEAIELVIAAASDNDAAVDTEAADVLYHLLVLLESRGRSLQRVLGLLEERTRQSGLEEKSKRS